MNGWDVDWSRFLLCLVAIIWAWSIGFRAGARRELERWTEDA